MKLIARSCELRLANPWKIASGTGSGTHRTVIVELSDGNGASAIGEAAPSSLYGESAEGTLKFLQQMDAAKLSFGDVPGSMKYLETLPGIPVAARCALNLALLDGAAKRAGKPLYDFFGLGFRESHHVTSFSIGIDTPEMVRKKVLDAAEYPVLKLKVGDPRDRENFGALREVAPDKPVRVDANEGWKTREEALRMLEWLVATDKKIQFVEQPMPRNAADKDLIWLKERSPLPVFADESCHTVKDIARCAECFHGVNVKLVKTGGASMAKETLQAARKAGLQTMIGCMIETSVLISAAAHLAELADFLDVDGNILITNDPFTGVTAKNGVLSFAGAKEKTGLRVRSRD
ncbi:MAG TPA: dipeptide epimerase [Candidatus Polarisedimenticolia bacterium]|nr:dipeptide epimerase [Candidatus Polarisedimenticolia bacterium]